jgi:hypothetical protein
MAAAAREYFTIDLRGLRAALAARAGRDGVTESEVLRGALVSALEDGRGEVSVPAARSAGQAASAAPLKMSVRLMRPVVGRLDQEARAAGLSRGAYLARLIQHAPAVASSVDRFAMCQALNNSSEELAVLSRDMNHLTQLLRRGEAEAAKVYRERHASLDRDVRAHLALAAAVLSDLSAMR